jgi:hypothetical protein
MFLADVYRPGTPDDTGTPRARRWIPCDAIVDGRVADSIRRAGTSYSNHITFNDNAMVRVLAMLDVARAPEGAPGGDVFTADQLARIPPPSPGASTSS